MLACASSVPSFGANSPTAKAEPRVALFTCLGRQMGALPLGPDEAFSALHGKRLERLSDGALAAPSQARVVITYQSIRPTYPICRPRPLPDAPAGRILPSELGGPRRRKWGAIDSDFFYRRRGWGKASHRPPWESAILARHRARGEQGSLFGDGATPVLGSQRDRQIDRHTLTNVP